MKKKHRDITVDGVKYGWISDVKGNGARVFKDGKPWFSFDSHAESIKPGIIKHLIQKELAK